MPRRHRTKTWAQPTDLRRRRHRRSPVWRYILLYLIVMNAAAFVIFDNSVTAISIEALAKADKIQHAGGFFVIVLLLGIVMRRWLSFGITAMVLLNLGIAVEIGQAYIPERSADFADFVANEVGIVAGLIALSIIDRMAAASRRARHHRSA